MDQGSFHSIQIQQFYHHIGPHNKCLLFGFGVEPSEFFLRQMNELLHHEDFSESEQKGAGNYKICDALRSEWKLNGFRASSQLLCLQTNVNIYWLGENVVLKMHTKRRIVQTNALPRTDTQELSYGSFTDPESGKTESIVTFERKTRRSTRQLNFNREELLSMEDRLKNALNPEKNDKKNDNESTLRSHPENFANWDSCNTVQSNGSDFEVVDSPLPSDGLHVEVQPFDMPLLDTKTAETSSFLKELTTVDLHSLSPADLKNSLVTEFDSGVHGGRRWDVDQVVFVQHVRPKEKTKNGRVFQKHNMQLNLEKKSEENSTKFPANDSLENTLTPMYVPSPLEKHGIDISERNYHYPQINIDPTLNSHSLDSHTGNNFNELAGGDHIEIRDGYRINHVTHETVKLGDEHHPQVEDPHRKTFRTFFHSRLVLDDETEEENNGADIDQVDTMKESPNTILPYVDFDAFMHKYHDTGITPVGTRNNSRKVHETKP